MANKTSNQSSSQSGSQSSGQQSGGQSSGQSGNFPLDNLTFDLVTLTYEKSKGLEAYNKYAQDAQGNQQAADLINRMRQQDEQCVQELRQLLGQMLGGQQSSQQGGQTTGGQSSGASASAGQGGAIGRGSTNE